MDNGRAEDIYVGIVFAMAALVVWGGCCDCWLYFDGKATITDFLRANPRWFYGPLTGILTFVAILTTHLFLIHK